MPDQNDIVFEQYQVDFLALFRAIFEVIGGSRAGSVTFDEVVSWISTAWDIFTVLSFIVSALLLFGLIYAYVRFNQLSDIEHQGLVNLEKLYQQLHQGQGGNDRWADIESHIQTDNPNDWKLAIIEADIMLEQMLNDAGYVGNTIGEKLKTASPAQFVTLDDAWSAHRVRNQIAHQGSDFVLTKKMANDTITQYRRVFTEFEII